MRCLFIAILFFLLGCKNDNLDVSGSQSTNLSSTLAYKEISGVESDLLSLDIYYYDDPTPDQPVIIWVHGGAWSIGDKANQIENKVNFARSLDYVLVSVNYRLSPFPYQLDNPERVMFPIHNLDVADAIRWVYDNIHEYGGNPDKLALLGHSAGAHLVALTGTNKDFLNQVGLNLSNLKGVASIDTEGYDVVKKIQDNDNLYINAFGSDDGNNRAASPLYNIQEGVAYPKFFIAKRGNANRIAISDEFVNRLEQNGVTVSQIDGSIYDHGGINNAIGEPDELLMTNALKIFFESCFE